MALFLANNPGRCCQRPGLFLACLSALLFATGAAAIASDATTDSATRVTTTSTTEVTEKTAEPNHTLTEASAITSATLANPYPQVARAYYVQLNAEPLWGQALTTRLPPASLTKLMTALLALQQGELQQLVTVSAKAAAMTGARLGLKAGQQISRQDLLTAMLLGSGNDACVALAESLAGTESAFVAQMNATAARWQLRDTAFANACGFDDERHYSSIRDLVQLTERVLAEPELKRLVALPEATVTVSGKPRRVTSSNALLGRLPGAIGVKTGYTNKAGKCIIALTERNGAQVLAVFLNAPDRWWDLAAIIELAFREARVRAAAKS